MLFVSSCELESCSSEVLGSSVDWADAMPDANERSPRNPCFRSRLVLFIFFSILARNSMFSCIPYQYYRLHSFVLLDGTYHKKMPQQRERAGLLNSAREKLILDVGEKVRWCVPPQAVLNICVAIERQKWQGDHLFICYEKRWSWPLGEAVELLPWSGH